MSIVKAMVLLGKRFQRDQRGTAMPRVAKAVARVGNRFHVDQRGTAMVEFCLCVPVIILMFMGIDYFRSGYARRLQALGASQTDAWKLAYSNDGSCFKQAGGMGFGGLAGIVAGAGTGGGQVAQDAVDQFSSSSGSSSMFKMGAPNTTRTESTHTAGWTKQKGTVSGHTYVLCNETVPDAKNDQDILSPLKGFITGQFQF